MWYCVTEQAFDLALATGAGDQASFQFFQQAIVQQVTDLLTQRGSIVQDLFGCPGPVGDSGDVRSLQLGIDVALCLLLTFFFLLRGVVHVVLELHVLEGAGGRGQGGQVVQQGEIPARIVMQAWLTLGGGGVAGGAGDALAGVGQRFDTDTINGDAAGGRAARLHCGELAGLRELLGHLTDRVSATGWRVATAALAFLLQVLQAIFEGGDFFDCVLAEILDFNVAGLELFEDQVLELIATAFGLQLTAGVVAHSVNHDDDLYSEMGDAPCPRWVRDSCAVACFRVPPDSLRNWPHLSPHSLALALTSKLSRRGTRAPPTS
ncbi:hypothetical protein D3C75_655940 [compost metagenome]